MKYPQDFSVIDSRTNEPVAAIRLHSDTYASFLGGHERVLELLKRKVPIRRWGIEQVLAEIDMVLKPGVPSWVRHDGHGTRWTPRFWVPPELEDWIIEEEAS